MGQVTPVLYYASSMDQHISELRAPLGFTRAEDVSPDHEREGMLRARTLPFGVDPYGALDFRSCVLNDCTKLENTEFLVDEAGFETIDLSSNVALQQAIETVRREDRLSTAAADALRLSLNGTPIRLANGRSLRIEHVADEGMIHRRAGPNGLDVNPDGMDGANGHGGAPGIHGDQDVLGTPLKQMMDGAAPTLFRHQTPDARNDDSSLFLLNLWIPIQQITRPLVLMDRRTLQPQCHQLRYGLPVTSFLDRDDEASVNDIWKFLPDPAQEWYFRSVMGSDQGYVFDTLGQAHGACILPGEEALEQLHLQIGRACEAVAKGDASALREATAAPSLALPEITTEAIRDAWQCMTELLAEAETQASEISALDEHWLSRARAAMDVVVRKSVEMRMVVTLSTE